jgi:hypothetical protein
VPPARLVPSTLFMSDFAQPASVKLVGRESHSELLAFAKPESPAWLTVEKVEESDAAVERFIVHIKGPTALARIDGKITFRINDPSCPEIELPVCVRTTTSVDSPN